jgi:hypothetical protein
MTDPSTLATFERHVRQGATGQIHSGIAEAAGIAQSSVTCRFCGQTKKVDGGECLRTGWPACCGQTMSLDRPS